MNLVELKEPPQNIDTYVKVPERFKFDEFVMNLKDLLKQKTANIEVEECSFAIIKSLENVIIENGYIIQFMRISGMSAHAHFYLEKYL
jgi:hypothetical protein